MDTGPLVADRPGRRGRSARVFGLSLALTAGVLGCGGSPQAETPAPAPAGVADPTSGPSGTVTGPSTSAAGPPATIAVGTGPAWALEKNAFPVPVDGAAFSFRIPKGWKIPPRDSKYVIWFKPESSGQLPRITVAAEKTDAPDVTAATVAAHRDAVAQGAASGAPPRAVLVGGRPAVETVAAARMGGRATKSTTLDTVLAGRRLRFTVDEFQDADPPATETLYAVFAGFTPPAAPPATPPGPAPASTEPTEGSATDPPAGPAPAPAETPADPPGETP